MTFEMAISIFNGLQVGLDVLMVGWLLRHAAALHWVDRWIHGANGVLRVQTQINDILARKGDTCSNAQGFTLTNGTELVVTREDS